jgi:hypothetical protein
MDAIRFRSIASVAAIQAVIALIALLNSPQAAAAAFAVGLISVGRYVAVGFFASSMEPGSSPVARSIAISAWALGFVALLILLAAVAAKAKTLLPWALAAAFAGPASLTLIALGSGLGLLASDRSQAKIHGAGGVK